MKIQKDIKIILNENTIEKIKICVQNASPYEACGLIFGNIKEIEVNEGFQYHYIGHKFKCIESTKKSTVAFLIDNIEELNEIYQNAARKYKLQLISIFHSHPGGAYPSSIDTKNMKYLNDFKAFKNLVWTIINAENYDLNGFIYFNKEFFQIVIVKNRE